MQLVCPSCAAGYTIKPQALGTTGRTVRCPACATTWFAWPEPAEPASSLAAPAEPAAETPPEPAQEVIPPEPAVSEPEGATSIEAAATRRTRARPARKPRSRPVGAPVASGGLAVLGVLVLALGAAVIWRQDLVRHVPDLAGLYARVGLPVNVRGLEFRDVAARVDFDAGQPVTVIEGAIVNVTGDSLALPRLRYSVRAPDGRELVSWAGAPPRPTIAPRESISFRGRLTSPVQGGNDIEVRFLGRNEGGRGAP